jgi:hypothetical protein
MTKSISSDCTAWEARVGKTLVKRVGTIARELQLFDEVLMATVSQNPNVIDIQNRMVTSGY